MKYLKLFENWINESGELVSKPFNPNNPDETLIIDISAQDLAKLDDQKMADVLSSIFNRAFMGKDEVLTDTKIEVIPCYFTDKPTTFVSHGEKFAKAEMSYGDEKFSIYSLIGDAEEESDFYFSKKFDNYIETAKGSYEPSFLVHLESKPIEFIKFAREKNIIRLSSRCFLIHPDVNWREVFKGGAETGAIAGNIYVQDTNNSDPYEIKMSLGDLIISLKDTMESNGKFTTNDTLVDAQTIGYYFSYELPDGKYIPKMGGVKKASA